MADHPAMTETAPGDAVAQHGGADAVVALTAALAAISALIHAGAAVGHYHEYRLYTPVFAGIALVQAGWGAALLRRPAPRALLALGAVFSAGVAVLWLISRTAGVPLAARAWVPEPVGPADLAVTINEVATVIVCVWLLRRRSGGRGAPRWLTAVLFGALAASVMFGLGAHTG